MTNQTQSEKNLRAKIARCESIIQRTQPICERETQTPGAFITGRSNRPKSLDRALDAENNRRAKAFKEYQQARQDRAHYQVLLDSLLAGTHHANGQPRADSPARQKRKTAEVEYADFICAMAKAGRPVAYPNGGIISIKRLNPKSVTTSMGTLWRYDEITLATEDGKSMDTKDMMALYKAWKAEQLGETQKVGIEKIAALAIKVAQEAVDLLRPFVGEDAYVSPIPEETALAAQTLLNQAVDLHGQVCEALGGVFMPRDVLVGEFWRTLDKAVSTAGNCVRIWINLSQRFSRQPSAINPCN